MILSFPKELFGIFIFLIFSLILKVSFISYEMNMNVLIFLMWATQAKMLHTLKILKHN